MATPAAVLAIIVEANTGKAEAALKEFQRNLSKADRAKAEAELGAEVDKGGFDVHSALVKKADMQKATATLGAEVDQGSFAKARSSMKAFGGDADKMNLSIGRTNQSFQFLRNNMKLFKWPALIAGAGQAAGAIGALGGGVAALSGALAPGIGLVTQYGTALGVLGQVAGVVAFAQLGDLTEALGGNEDALERLTPEARKFVDTLKSFQGRFDAIREATQRPLFAGLNKGLQAAMENFGPFRDVMQGTARVMGDLAERFGKFVGSASFGRDFRKIGETNNRVLSRMGRAAINLAHILTDILVAARPLTNWISRMTLAWSDNLRVQTAAARSSGKLAEFFRETRQVTSRLVSILGDMGAALWNIIRLGKPLGDSILKNLAQSAKEFRKWTESAKGENTIAQYFEDIKPALFEMGRLTRDLVKAFFELSQQPALTGIIHQLRTELLPALTETVKQTSKAFGPAFISLLTEVAKLFASLAGASGPLTVYVRGMTQAVRLMNKFFDLVPGLQSGVVALVGLAGVLKALTFTAQITGLKKMGELLGVNAALSARMKTAFTKWALVVGTAVQSATAALQQWVGGIYGKLSDKLKTSGTMSGTAWGKWFARGAIVGLIVGIPLLAKEINDRFGKEINKTFRKASQAVDRFADKFGPLKEAVKGPLQFVIDIVRHAWGVLKNVGKLFDDLVHGRWKEAWQDLKNIARNSIGYILDRAKTMVAPFRIFARFIQRVWEDLDLKEPFRGLAGFVKGAFEPIKDAVRWLKGAVKWLIDKIPDIPDLPDLPSVPKKGGGVPFVPGIQKGGLVTAEGIVPFAGYARGGIVGVGGPKPGPQDKIPALLEVGELVLPKKLVDETRKGSKQVALVMSEEFDKGYQEVTGKSEDFVKRHDKSIRNLREDAAKNTERFRKQTVDDFGKTEDRATGLTKKLGDNVSKGFTRMRGESVDESKKMKQGVSGAFGSMAKAVGEGLGRVAKMTNNSLKALGVAKVDFNISTQKKQRGGQIAGAGEGDKVHAMLEPGEFVVNKKATAAARPMLEKLNSEVPRFAKGGIVAAGQLAEKMGLAPSEHPAFGGVGAGHVAGSYHYKNQAIDVSGGNMRRYFQAVANRWFGHGLAELFYDAMPRYVKHDNWVSGQIGNHMDHVHVAITSAFGGAMAKKVKEVLLKGPKGPLKDMGQAAIDKVRKAANAYIDKKTPEGAEGIAMTGSGDVEKMFAKVAKRLSTSKTATLALGMAGYAESGMRDLAYGDSTSQGALQLLSTTAAGLGVSPHDEKAIASLFFQRGFYGRGGANKLAAQGLPAHLVAQGVQGSADSSGSNYAAQTSSARAWMKRFNLQRGGIVAPYVGAFQKGGEVSKTGLGLLHEGEHVVPKMKKGGEVAKRGTGGTRAGDGRGAVGLGVEGIRRLGRNVREQLGKVVPKLDEKIDIASQLAGASFSPGGSELTKPEVDKQMKLQNKLLDSLTKTFNLADRGLRLIERRIKRVEDDIKKFERRIKREQGKKKPDKRRIEDLGRHLERRATAHRALGAMAPGLREAIVEMGGLTGRGGRIFDTKLAIKELRATGQPQGVNIGQLLEFAEAMRFGAFNRQLGTVGDLPTFAKGGTVRGRPGQPVPVIAHGGEQFLGVGQSAATVINVEARVFVGDREITDIVRTEIKVSDRKKASHYRAGVVR